MPTINLSGLASNLQNYVSVNKELLRNSYRKPQFQDIFTVREGNKNKMYLPKLKIGDLSEPRKSSPTAREGVIQFSNELLEVKPVQITLKLNPFELWESWLETLKSKGQKPDELPFEQFIMEDIINKFYEEIHLTSFRGVYNPTGTSFLDNFNGINKHIADKITAGLVNVVATPAFTASNVRSNLLTIYNAAPEEVKDRTDLQMIVPALEYDYYMQGFDPNINQNNSTSLPSNLFGTNAKLIRSTAQNLKRVILAPKPCLQFGADTVNDIEKIRVQLILRDLYVMIDATMGTSLAQPEYVTVNSL